MRQGTDLQCPLCSALTPCLPVPCSSLEMTCYDSDEANPRSVSSLSNRSSPLSWRYGQSSPRLQAGDAPSVGGSCRSEGTPSWYMHGERAHYSHTMPMRSPSKLSHISRLELVEALDTDDVELKSGYMSDSDLMGKTLTEDDDITTGYVPVLGILPGLGLSGWFHPLLLFGHTWHGVGWSGTASLARIGSWPHIPGDASLPAVLEVLGQLGILGADGLLRQNELFSQRVGSVQLDLGVPGAGR